VPGGGVAGGGGIIGGRPSLAMAATGANMDNKNAETINMMPYLLIERMIPPFILFIVAISMPFPQPFIF
jgi:hypothetical protein